MLQIWKKYGFNFKTTLNAAKCPLLYFNYIHWPTSHNELSTIKMRDGNIMHFVYKYDHLGTTICSYVKMMLIMNYIDVDFSSFKCILYEHV